MQEYWQKQTASKPLFEDILWSRPETKHGAGKLLIIGGNLHGFASVGEAYGAAEKSGAGHIRLVLPDALRKTVGPLGPYEFAPSTPSGSFARNALNELLIWASWSDTVLLAGDFGKNSETAVVLENFARKYRGPLLVSQDAIDYFLMHPELLFDRELTAIVPDMPQLQKLAVHHKFEIPFLHDMGLMLLTQALHSLTKDIQAVIITKEQDTVVVTHREMVSSTKIPDDNRHWQPDISARAAVFWMQNPTKPYESITTSLII